jgi:hypothetical protein
MRPLLFGLLLGACSPTAAAPVVSPSDDPADWEVDSTLEYTPHFTEPQWVIPAHNLPPEARAQPSNNNVDIALFEGRLYLGWRTGPTHFASPDVKLHLVSSDDLGHSWKYETSIALGSDCREPSFVALGGTLRFQFFQAGTEMFSFEPKAQWRMSRGADGGWSSLEQWGEPAEVSWNYKVRGGVAWRTSYRGTHYEFGKVPNIEARFTRSDDGRSWAPVKGDGVVYRGGVSEMAFEFDEDGSLWAVTRNEDGDATGFGSHVCTALKDDLGQWTCSPKSFPERYDSPKLLRHGKDIYLLGRRDIGGPFDQMKTQLSFGDQQLQYAASYWGRPKRTALYKINKQAKSIEWLQDLPSCGDTSFPAIARLDAHRFLIANYTSPLDDLDIGWLQGQTSTKGTRIYLTTLQFEATR